MRASFRLSLAVVLLLSCWLLCNSDRVLVQVDRGSIVGLVTDPAGARVSGAQVTPSPRL